MRTYQILKTDIMLLLKEVNELKRPRFVSRPKHMNTKRMLKILREKPEVKLESLDDRKTSFHHCNILSEPTLSLSQTKLSTSEGAI